VVVEVISTIVL